MRKVILREKKPIKAKRVTEILKQRGKEYGDFTNNIACINGFMFASKSDLNPEIHHTTFMLVCLKMARLLYLLENNPTADFKDTDSYVDLCGYIKLICDNYEPRVAGFRLSEFDKPNVQKLKLIANELFQQEIFARIEREEAEDEL